MGAAGLYNLLAAAEASADGLLPPTAMQGRAIEGIDLVLGEPRTIKAGGPVLALASGFGGNNVAIVVDGRGDTA